MRSARIFILGAALLVGSSVSAQSTVHTYMTPQGNGSAVTMPLLGGGSVTTFAGPVFGGTGTVTTIPGGVGGGCTQLYSFPAAGGFGVQNSVPTLGGGSVNTFSGPLFERR